MLGQHWRAGEQLAVERGQHDDPEVVLVSRGGDQLAHGHLALQLFGDLPRERIARSLAGLDLAAGELPHAGQSPAGSALGAQNKAFANYDGTDDVDLFLH